MCVITNAEVDRKYKVYPNKCNGIMLNSYQKLDKHEITFFQRCIFQVTENNPPYLHYKTNIDIAFRGICFNNNLVLIVNGTKAA